MPLKDPDARRAYQAALMRTDEQRAKRREWQRRRYAEDPEYRERMKARNRTVPPVVTAARQRVYNAVKSGRLIRPDSCEQCGTPCKPEAAHSDYAKPLDVRWLCRPCHRTWDAEHPKVQHA